MKDDVKISEELEELEELELKKALYLVKNHLIFGSTDTLLKQCSSKKNYIEFLKLIFLLFEKEPEFLVFATDEASKISDIINHKRDEYYTDEIKELENDIIINLNIIKNDPQCYKLKNEYIDIQEKDRLCCFESEKQLKSSIGYDAIVISALENNTLDNVEDAYFILSTAYLLDDFKEMYQYNRNYIDMSVERLKSVKKNPILNKTSKRKIKIIEKQLKNIAKKS